MCDDCNHEYWASIARDALDTGRLSDSDSTFLHGIAEWIDDNAHVTPDQVAKIKEKADLVEVDYDG